MCGITGWVDLTRSSKDQRLRSFATSMNDAISHRGPDDSGVWADPKVGLALAHRRLSIFDLSPEGRQPMVSHDGRYVLVFNGEIYNFEALRPEVNGYPFRSTSDSEVLLALIQKLGVVEAIKKHNGMLAVAVWDRHAETLYLARDRFGKKPLFYGHINDILVFGSELRAIEAHPDVSLEIDRVALHNYVSYKNVPAPYSIFQNVRKVKAGEILSINLSKRSFFERSRVWNAMLGFESLQYWDLEKVSRQTRGQHEDPVGELESLLLDATNIRMAADVPLGAFLSGGIDSSLVVGMMQRLSDVPVSTFSIGFEESEKDESKHAAEVAKFLATDHHAWMLTAKDALDVVPDVPSVFDEPFADPSMLPTILLARKTREYVTVALSGDGGDEVFGGYPRYIPYRLDRGAETLLKRASPLWEAIGPTAGFGANVAKRLNRDKLAARLATVDSIFADRARKYLTRMRSWEGPTSLVLGIDKRWKGDPYITFNAPHTSFREFAMAMDQASYLTDDILVKVDRATMHVALECRSPLLDTRVCEFSWRLRPEQRNPGGDRELKGILKTLAYQYVPKRILDRPKQGFGIPVDAWLGGELKEWARDLLMDDTGYFDQDQIRRHWNEHQSGDRDWGVDLWVVLMFQAWLRR